MGGELPGALGARPVKAPLWIGAADQGRGPTPHARSYEPGPAVIGAFVFLVVIGAMVTWMFSWQQQAGGYGRASAAAESGAEEDPQAPALLEGYPALWPVGPEEVAPPQAAEGLWSPGPVGPSLPPRQPPARSGPAGPRVAIIIDDWGYPWSAAEGFLAFEEPLTIAVLPFLPASREQAAAAARAGHQVLVHLPMEPVDPEADPGPGAVRVHMSDAEIRSAVRRALRSLPAAVGVNNHMGSRATADERVMRLVLETLRDERVFFVDSHTSHASVVRRLARELNLPYGVNQVFLDHLLDPEWVKGRLLLLASLAEREGSAIGIGHVRPETYQALREVLPEFRRLGIRLVTVSELLRYPPGFEQPALRPAEAAR